MLNRIIWSLTLALGFCASPALARETSTPTKPMKVLLDTWPIEHFLKENFDSKLPLINKATIEKARALLQEKYAGGEKLTGFSSMVSKGLDTMGLKPTNLGPDGTAEACRQARREKEAWHLDPNNGGKLPPTFGKMFNYALYKVDEAAPADGSLWLGRVETCTWSGTDEYYFDIRFKAGEDQLRLVKKKSQNTDDPFPDTLNLDGIPDPADRQRMVDMMSMWDWKLHANGQSITYVSAKKNGRDISLGDPIFVNPSENCFDIFFAGSAAPESLELPNQSNFCMGRCDARIINTP